MEQVFHSFARRKDSAARSFSLTVTGTENCEWQGVLRAPDGTEQVFRSVLELLTEIEAQLGNAEENK